MQRWQHCRCRAGALPRSPLCIHACIFVIEISLSISPQPELSMKDARKPVDRTPQAATRCLCVCVQVATRKLATEHACAMQNWKATLSQKTALEAQMREAEGLAALQEGGEGALDSLQQRFNGQAKELAAAQAQVGGFLLSYEKKG
jgi:hypothetical protein